MEKWVSDIYEAAIAKQEEYGLEKGMAVFYSPVIYKPKILFIGDNPGGGVGTVHQSPPKVSEYVEQNYELAIKMRMIFSTPELTDIITKGVITNRVFFQSNGIKEFQKLGIWNEMKKWCMPHVKSIIEHIDPEIIFAQSIGAYEALVKGMGGKFKEVLIPDSGRGLLRSGEIGEKMILGIKHPTSQYHRVSDEKWKPVTKKLSEVILI